MAFRTDKDKRPTPKELRMTNLSLNSRDVRIDIGIKFRKMCGKQVFNKDDKGVNKISWNTLWMKDLKDNKPKAPEKVILKRPIIGKQKKDDDSDGFNDRLEKTIKPIRPTSAKPNA